MEIQADVASRVIDTDQLGDVKYVGGVDVTHSDNNVAVAGLVVVDADDLHVVYQDTIVGENSVPYVSSFLGFREVNLYVQLLQRMQNQVGYLPDIVLVDGNGVLHERQAGCASHLGVVANIPTIGVSKKYYTYIPSLPSAEELDHLWSEALARSEDQVFLQDSSRVYGVAMRANTSSCRPIFVSIGHKISLQRAIDIVQKVAGKYRIPEPVRLADILTRKILREHLIVDK